MRLLVEIFIVGALLYIGWEKPFREYLPASMSEAAKSTPTPTPARTTPDQPVVRSTSTPSGAWLYDPNRHTALDTPATRAQPSASVSGSWMFDSKRRSTLDPPRKAAPPH